MSFSTRSATSSINIDNLLDRRMRTLYKVLKGFTSSAQTDLARRATTGKHDPPASTRSISLRFAQSASLRRPAIRRSLMSPFLT